MKDLLLKLWVRAQMLRDDSGQDLIEYALIAGLVSLAVVGGINGVAGSLNDLWGRVVAQLDLAIVG